MQACSKSVCQSANTHLWLPGDHRQRWSSVKRTMADVVTGNAHSCAEEHAMAWGVRCCRGQGLLVLAGASMFQRRSTLLPACAAGGAEDGAGGGGAAGDRDKRRGGARGLLAHLLPHRVAQGGGQLAAVRGARRPHRRRHDGEVHGICAVCRKSSVVQGSAGCSLGARGVCRGGCSCMAGKRVSRRCRIMNRGNYSSFSDVFYFIMSW